MKKQLLLQLFFLMSSIGSFAQYNWDSKRWDRESLGFGCSISGQMTLPVSRMTKLLTEKRFKEIREALNSKLPADQYLATFLLEKLSEKGELKISDEEQKRIQTIKSSNKMVPFCSGCTLWTEMPLNEMLGVNTQEIVSVSAGYWFDNYYKKENK